MNRIWLLLWCFAAALCCGAVCDARGVDPQSSAGQASNNSVAATVPNAASAAMPSGAASIAASWTITNAPVRPIRAPGVPNFGKLNDHIWRSGQPSREGYKYLAAQGLKTVVNLRAEFPQDESLLPTGVKYIYIPIPDEHAPTQEQAAQFIKVASDPANWPLLVHCMGGQGRAGTMAALVRSSLDKWNELTVMKEVANFRHNQYLGFIKLPMAEVQKRFIEKWAAEQQVQAPKVTPVIDKTSVSNPTS